MIPGENEDRAKAERFKNKRGQAATSLTTLGGRIRAAREAFGEYQSAIARACKVTNNAVSLWEKNKAHPGKDKLETLCARYGLELEWLMFGKGTPPNLPKLPPQAKPLQKQERQNVIRSMKTVAKIIEWDESGKPNIARTWEVPIGMIVENWHVEHPEHLVIWRSRSEHKPEVLRRGACCFIDTNHTRPDVPNFLWLYDCPDIGLTLARSRHGTKRIELIAPNGKLIPVSEWDRIKGRLVAVLHAVVI